MSDTDATGQVLLKDGRSASAILHKLLSQAAADFPAALQEAKIPPQADAFRKHYPDVLTTFEATRLNSTERKQIAKQLVQQLQQHIIWQAGDEGLPLHESLRSPAPALPLKSHTFTGQAGWRPNLVYRGERFEASQLADLGAQLVARNVITEAAGTALGWVANEALAEGKLSLTGRKIAVLGGGAEMAPTRLWLEAGADVLWLDTQPPPEEWWQSDSLSGRLFWTAAPVDLLTQPHQVLATLIEFAEGKPLDLGLYAYAPGQARELRLSACMNALVNALPQELVGSVTILVSPTTPTALSAHDLECIERQLNNRPVWETICARLGLLGKGDSYVTVGNAHATRTVVAIQGASYQAAQYLSKILIAEVWAAYGQLGARQAKPLRVSANTAAITRTRSLDHPVFAAAFGGAAAFGVETLVPRQSRRLNGLLAIHDWLHPDLPIPGLIRVHGAIHTLAYPLGSALRVAAAIGFARAPRLLRGLISKS